MNINFKTLLRTACLLLLLLGGSFKQAMASHFAAADINVQCLSQDSFQNKYRITLSVYFACQDSLYYWSDPSHPSPSPAQNTATVSWKTANGGTSQSGNRPMTASILDTVDQLCPILHTQNACYTPRSIYPGFARRVFTDTITLPSRQTDWVFSWDGNARNPNILNLNNPAVTLYIEAGLNNTGKYWNNSTPVFNASPLPYFCVNQKNAISTDPIDSNIFFDGANTYDSFRVYSIQPRSGPAAPIPYNTGYATNNPFGTTPNSFSMNEQSGNATFIGPNTGYYVVTFRCVSYDKETKLPTGYCERDVQTSVLGCAAPPPAIDSTPINFSGGILPGNVLSICPNQETKFDFVAKSLSNTNYIRLTYNGGTVRNGSYTYDTLGGVTTGHFSWTPTTADIGTHFIEFKATDTTCDPSQPILLSQSLKVTLIVRPGLDAGPDQRICPLGDQPVQLNVNGPTNKVYRWYSGTKGTPLYINNRDIQNPLVTPPVDYAYIVASTDPDFVCKSQDTVVVRIDRSNGVSVLQDPLVVCRPSYITIGADSIGTGPIQNIPCGSFNTIACATPEVITVGSTGNPALIKENTPFYSNKLYHKYQFIVPKSELKSAGLYSGTLRSISFKSNNNVLAVMPLGPMSISLACTEKTSFASATNDAFEANTTQVALDPAFTITPNAWNKISFTTPYNWDTTKNLIVSVCMGPYTTADTNGFDPVDMAFGSTIQRFSNVVDICNLNAIGTDIRRYTQRPIVQFDYCSAPVLPYDYHWHPGTNLADSTTKYTTAYVPYSMNYAVYTKGKNGCLLRDSLHIILPVYKLTVNPNDTAICVNQPAPLLASGAANYKWYENGFNTPTTLSCDDCANPVATPTTPGDITYTVVFMNPDNCFDTLQQKIHVYPLPNVSIVNNDTVIKYGQSVMLMVNGGNQYTWTPVGTLNNPNIPNPVATPTQSTTYIVYGIDQNKCRNTDSVRVNVDFRDNLLIPTGFTPNGDGRNDYFKVVNVTFQKLMEFRVFNRWGQEVFTTNDPMKGWDGKWKGIDQDLGTYKYIIRVAFPDGYSETYKGDVTLIR